MIEMPNMLMVAGNVRNIGKTTFACAVIERFSALWRIYGIKVTSMRAGEESFHGNHTNQDGNTFIKFEEMNSLSNKDTAKMLRAGADKAFYIQVEDANLKDTARYLAENFSGECLLVCESSSLRREIKPGAFVFLNSGISGMQKKNTDLLQIADIVIHCTSEIKEVLKNIDKINLIDNRWVINN